MWKCSCNNWCAEKYKACPYCGQAKPADLPVVPKQQDKMPPTTKKPVITKAGNTTTGERSAKPAAEEKSTRTPQPAANAKRSEVAAPVNRAEEKVQEPIQTVRETGKKVKEVRFTKIGFWGSVTWAVTCVGYVGFFLNLVDSSPTEILANTLSSHNPWAVPALLVIVLCLGILLKYIALPFRYRSWRVLKPWQELGLELLVLCGWFLTPAAIEILVTWFAGVSTILLGICMACALPYWIIGLKGSLERREVPQANQR